MPVGITLLGESCRKMNFVVVVVPVVACRVLWSRTEMMSGSGVEVDLAKHMR